MRAIFDLDGTLIDSAPDIHAAGNAVLESEGLPTLGFDEARSFIGNGARVFIERMERAATGENNPDRTERMRARFAREYETAHGLTRVYPGVETALGALRAQGWRLGLCTNKPVSPTMAVLRHFGWTDLFDVVIGGDSLPVIKPDPAPLRAAMAAMIDAPLVYVGDSEVDAATAVAADVPFALFTGGYRKTAVETIPHTRAFDHWDALPEIAALIAR
ncbi:MAG: phosphoglycolate phosphatase [Paracoccaceae bacterium]